MTDWVESIGTTVTRDAKRLPALLPPILRLESGRLYVGGCGPLQQGQEVDEAWLEEQVAAGEASLFLCPLRVPSGSIRVDVSCTEPPQGVHPEALAETLRGLHNDALHRAEARLRLHGLDPPCVDELAYACRARSDDLFSRAALLQAWRRLDLPQALLGPLHGPLRLATREQLRQSFRGRGCWPWLRRLALAEVDTLGFARLQPPTVRPGRLDPHKRPGGSVHWACGLQAKGSPDPIVTADAAAGSGGT